MDTMSKDERYFLEVNLATHILDKMDMADLYQLAYDKMLDNFDNLSDNELLAEAEYAGYEPNNHAIDA